MENLKISLFAGMRDLTSFLPSRRGSGLISAMGTGLRRYNERRAQSAALYSPSAILLVSFVLLSVSPWPAAAGAAANNGKFVIFDVPGSTCLPAFGSCTQASAINLEGTVVGTYNDATRTIHGFLRTADGRFIDIDPPGSGFIAVVGINAAGTVAGWFFDANGAHGFIRSRDGTFTVVDPSGSLFTQISGLNEEGTVTGNFEAADFVPHGFVRFPDGKTVTFDASPDAVNGTMPAGINAEGTIVGNYVDVNFLPHGFLRDPDGTLATFDASPEAVNGTYPTAINWAGDVTGSYADADIFYHGFVPTRQGKFTFFDASPTKFVTQPNGINLVGMITGSYQDAFKPVHGFLRTPNGTITSFDPPGSVLTAASAINLAGAVAGWFDDAGELQHAFIRLPSPLLFAGRSH